MYDTATQDPVLHRSACSYLGTGLSLTMECIRVPPHLLYHQAVSLPLRLQVSDHSNFLAFPI